MSLLAATSVVIAGCGGGDGGNGAGGAAVSAPVPLAIITQPAPTSAAWNQPATLSVSARGKGPLAYQWYQDGVAILSANASSWGRDRLSASDAGLYHVVVTDSTGAQVVSNDVALTVTDLNLDTSATTQSGRLFVDPLVGRSMHLPDAHTSWQLIFRYTVPPLPSFATFSPAAGDDFYIWGDIDFDQYGASGWGLDGYEYNQVTPQLFLGDALTGNTASYSPLWSTGSTWAIEAQYFWQKGSTPYAQTGPVVDVVPGDLLTETIAYDAVDGSITASISAPEGTSTILIPAPFPDAPGLFASWGDFFRQAQALSGGGDLLGTPEMNIEPHGADDQTVCSILPFVVNGISVPGVGSTSSDYATAIPQGLPCNKPTQLAF